MGEEAARQREGGQTVNSKYNPEGAGGRNSNRIFEEASVSSYPGHVDCVPAAGDNLLISAHIRVRHLQGGGEVRGNRCGGDIGLQYQSLAALDKYCMGTTFDQ